MHESHWRIDEHLGLVAADEQGANDCPLLVAPEQTMDVILLRNMDIIPTALFGSPGRFLFHSALYWGEFDICCALADRRLVAFENKGRRLTKRDFDKFCRDVRRINADRGAYIQMRYQHVLDGFQGYMTAAERMFAAVFLGIRSDVVRDNRDLITEACDALSISREQFHERFNFRNNWLAALGSRPTLDDYLSEFAKGIDWQAFCPILLVPDGDISRIREWCLALGNPMGMTAHLAIYRFRTCNPPFPESLSVRYAGTFTI